jgi:hypothetical protein
MSKFAYITLALFFGFTSTANAVVIDSFLDSGDATITVSPTYDGFKPFSVSGPAFGPTVTSTFTPAFVDDTISDVAGGIGFGGTRGGSLTFVSGGGTDDISAAISGGVLGIAGSGAATGSVGLLYDFVTPADLSSFTGIELNYTAFNAGSGTETVSLTVTDSDGAPSTHTEPISLTGFTGGIIEFDLADFAGAGLTLSSVSQLEFTFAVDSGTDFQITSVDAVAVPEPISAFCWITVLGGLFLARRLRK